VLRLAVQRVLHFPLIRNNHPRDLDSIQKPMTEKDDNEQEPKIIVDSDWKEQVAKEKEAAAQQPANEDSQASPGPESEEKLDDFVAKQPSAEPSSEQPAALPSASFDVLVSMLFTQAMALLGQIPDPSGEEIQINKPFAKHTIDTLEMLGEKTKGNLTDEEAKMLSEALHALRMAYVDTKE